jgi:hypothetical protein
VIGYIFYRSQIFNRYTGAFSFLIYGFIGSLFFYLLRVNINDALAALVVLSIMNSAFITHATRVVYLLRDFIMIGAFSSAIFIFYQYFYSKSQKDRWLEPLILSAVVAMFSLVATFLLVLIHNAVSIVTLYWIYSIARLYFLIGLGIGVGIIVSEEPYSGKIRGYFLNFFRS